MAVLYTNISNQSILVGGDESYELEAGESVELGISHPSPADFIMQKNGLITIEATSGGDSDDTDIQVSHGGSSGSGGGDASEATLAEIKDKLEQLIASQGMSTNTIMEVDEGTPGIAYIAIAPRGSDVNDPVWAIMKYIMVGTSTSKRVALNVAWTGFDSHTYS